MTLGPSAPAQSLHPYVLECACCRPRARYAASRQNELASAEKRIGEWRGIRDKSGGDQSEVRLAGVDEV
jgi:hypothetical protein